MLDIDEYESILKECIFVSKPDGWFLEGFQVEISRCFYPQFKDGDKFNSKSAIVYGLTLEEVKDDIPAFDGESCPLDEFEIYDKWGNEISELTLREYKELIRNTKIEKIIE